MRVSPEILPAGRNRSTWWLLGIAILLVGAILVYVHVTETRRVEATERDRLSVQADVISRDLERNLGAINLALEGVIRDYLDAGSSASTPQDVSRRLRALVEAVAGVRGMGVYDRNGVMLASNRAELVGRDFSSRDYFTRVRDKPDAATLYLSRPFKSVDNDLVMTVGRMVQVPGGGFGGLIVATLDPQYFANVLRPIVYAPDVRAFLVHGEGVQLMNFPVIQDIDGTNLDQPGTLFRRHLDSGQIASMLTGTVYTTGQQRLMALRSVQPPPLHMDRPLVVGVSRELGAIQQPMRRQALVFGLIYAASALLCGASLFWTQNRDMRMNVLAGDLERERRDAAERLKLALRGANLGLWEFQVPTGHWSCDETACAMLGSTVQELDATPERWRARMHPHDRPASQAAFDACVDGSAPFYDSSYRIQHSDGRWVWILARGTAIERDEQGKVTRVMGTVMDISLAKNAEFEVVQARNELQAVFDNMREAVCVFDKHNNLVRINRAGRTVHGLFAPDTPVDEVRNKIEVLLANGEVLPRDQWPSARAIRGDFVRGFEARMRRIDTGQSIYIESDTAPIPDAPGQPELVIHSYHDVSERRVTLALRQSEARFRTLIEDAPLAVVILRGGNIIYSNPRYRALHGYERDDDLTGLAWSAMLTPESRAALAARQALIAEDSPVEQSFEALGLGKAGAPVPVHKMTARVELADGPATLVFAQDVSAQKQAEAALLLARDVAESASRSKAEFLANMSHEIRSPLNVILGLAYLLEKGQLGRDARDMVQKIRVSGRGLLGLVNDILDVSKIDAGRMELEDAPFRLGDVIENVAGTMGIAAGDKQIELIIEPLPAGTGAFYGDALRLEQVLANLTSNAIKFTSAGQVALRVRETGHREGFTSLHFSVKDSGIGIPLELQAEVFTAFSQADSSTTRRFGGSGLGLTICRQLVALMGGEIGVVSTVGIGSEFWFTVPLRPFAGAEVSSPEMLQINALVADDSAIARDAVVAIGQGLGWCVEAVDSGEAALSMVLQRRDGNDLPDVVVLDWKMPGLDGLATARAIREAAPAVECPIVIMATAYSLSALATEPGAELVDAILSKPVTASALFNSVIEARRSRAATVRLPQANDAAASQELLGVRLLVVDDSEINCAIAKRILEEHGASVELAFDGGSAMDWLLAHPDEVDLVLMDVQMPVMDGLEVTRRLRRMPRFQNLPVVALTAGAFKSQQDVVREAGMTDFVSKPFDVPLTVALIQRLTRGQHQRAVALDRAQPVAPVPKAVEGAAPERLAMDVAHGLRTWGEPDIYRDYLRRFLASDAHTAAAIATSLANGDRVAASALAHKLAGVTAIMALPDAARLSAELERALYEGREATGILERLDSALEEAFVQIRRYAAPSAPPGAAKESAAPMLDDATKARALALLAQLLRALDSDSPNAAEPVLHQLGRILPEPSLAAIQDCLRGFDFRGAEARTRELATELELKSRG